jgi:hypothetical protein
VLVRTPGWSPRGDERASGVLSCNQVPATRRVSPRTKEAKNNSMEFDEGPLSPEPTSTEKSAPSGHDRPEFRGRALVDCRDFKDAAAENDEAPSGGTGGGFGERWILCRGPHTVIRTSGHGKTGRERLVRSGCPRLRLVSSTACSSSSQWDRKASRMRIEFSWRTIVGDRADRVVDRVSGVKIRA